MESIRLTTLDVDALRTRLRKMSDEELREFGKAARYMVSPTANMGKPPLPTFVLQLEELALNGGGDRNEIRSVTNVIILAHKLPMARCFVIQPFDGRYRQPLKLVSLPVPPRPRRLFSTSWSLPGARFRLRCP